MLNPSSESTPESGLSCNEGDHALDTRSCEHPKGRLALSTRMTPREANLSAQGGRFRGRTDTREERKFWASYIRSVAELDLGSTPTRRVPQTRVASGCSDGRVLKLNYLQNGRQISPSIQALCTPKIRTKRVSLCRWLRALPRGQPCCLQPILERMCASHGGLLRGGTVHTAHYR